MPRLIVAHNVIWISKLFSYLSRALIVFVEIF